MRRNFFSNRVVAQYNSLPDNVKKASSVNGFKARLDEFLGTPAPLLRRETVGPRHRGGEEEGDQQVV